MATVFGGDADGRSGAVGHCRGGCVKAGAFCQFCVGVGTERLQPGFGLADGDHEGSECDVAGAFADAGRGRSQRDPVEGQQSSVRTLQSQFGVVVAEGMGFSRWVMRDEAVGDDSGGGVGKPNVDMLRQA